MSEPKKRSDQEMWDEMNTNRGGRREGGTPDYEKNQSPSTPQKDFNTKDTDWS